MLDDDMVELVQSVGRVRIREANSRGHEQHE